MRQFWNHILENEMQLDLAQCQIMIIDSPVSIKEERQKLAEVFFEELKVNALLFMNSSVLSLFSTGRTR
jgi:actin-related protein